MALTHPPLTDPPTSMCLPPLWTCPKFVLKMRWEHLHYIPWNEKLATVLSSCPGINFLCESHLRLKSRKFEDVLFISQLSWNLMKCCLHRFSLFPPVLIAFLLLGICCKSSHIVLTGRRGNIMSENWKRLSVCFFLLSVNLYIFHAKRSGWAVPENVWTRKLEYEGEVLHTCVIDKLTGYRPLPRNI